MNADAVTDKVIATLGKVNFLMNFINKTLISQESDDSSWKGS
jgi:hypothetical protein